MPKKDPGPSVKDKKLYERLRDDGNSKQKAARIANAAGSSRRKVSMKGGRSPSYGAPPSATNDAPYAFLFVATCLLGAPVRFAS